MMKTQDTIREEVQSHIYDLSSSATLRGLGEAIANADCCETVADLKTNIDEAVMAAEAILTKLRFAQRRAAKLKETV